MNNAHFVLSESVNQSELYSSNQAREEGIIAVRRNAPAAALVDQA